MSTDPRSITRGGNRERKAQKILGWGLFGFGEADQVMNGIAHLLSFHRSELTQQQLRIAELMREGRTQLEAAEH